MEKLREKKRLVHFLGGTLAAILALVIGVWIVSAQTTSPVARSTVTVSVTDDLGHSVPGATVTIQGRGQNGNDPATYRQGLTDGTGVLKAELLAAGDYTVVAALGDLSQSKAVNVAEDGESFVQIRLVTMGATVSGRVTNGQSAGVGNVRIVLAGNYPPLERQARSDGGGGFAVGQVPDGRFLVAAEDVQGHYLSAGQPVVVSGGQVLGSPITLLLAQPQEAGTISGQVVSTELNSAVFRFEITASDVSGAIQARTSLAPGQAAFELANVPPGIYRLALMRLGASAATREVGATPGVVLTPGGELTGVSVVDREP